MPSILRAQTNYPDRPITVIVAFAAGDRRAIARIYAEFLSRDLGKTLVIENVAGAGGTIGSSRAARATPDGYTTRSARPAPRVQRRALQEPEVQPHHGLRTSRDCSATFRRCSSSSVTFRLITSRHSWNMSAPNEAKLNAGTAGPGSSAHMGAAMLNVRLGTKINLVSYRGTGPAMNDLIAGQIDYMVEVSLTALAQIQAKTVRPLAVFRSARISTLLDVPSTNEFGVDGLYFPVWLGFLAPQGTPQPIVVGRTPRSARQPRTLTSSPASPPSAWKCQRKLRIPRPASATMSSRKSIAGYR